MFKAWNAWDLVNMGLFEEAEARGVDYVNFWISLHQGRLERARELAESVSANSYYPGWIRYGPKRALTWEMRTEMGIAPFRSAVAEHVNYYAEEDIPWTDTCRLYLLYDMKQAGISEGVEEMMDKCRKTTEERLKARYLCPCSWFNLVTFATIDGRIEDAIEHTREWLDNGDSYSLLYMDPVIKEWADRPEYQEFLDRNDEQVKRQQDLYLAGVKARDKAASPESKVSGS
jgi:hypothetical protein